jgi:hypothetical protein
VRPKGRIPDDVGNAARSRRTSKTTHSYRRRRDLQIGKAPAKVIRRVASYS